MSDDTGNDHDHSASTPLQRRTWTLPCVDWRGGRRDIADLIVAAERGENAGVSFHPPAGEYAKILLRDVAQLREILAAAEEFARVPIR